MTTADDIRLTLQLWAERKAYCEAKIATLQESLDNIERDWRKMEAKLNELEKQEL